MEVEQRRRQGGRASAAVPSHRRGSRLLYSVVVGGGVLLGTAALIVAVGLQRGPKQHETISSPSTQSSGLVAATTDPRQRMAVHVPILQHVRGQAVQRTGESEHAPRDGGTEDAGAVQQLAAKRWDAILREFPYSAPDAKWTSDMSSMMKALLDVTDAGGASFDVDCRTDTCRVSVAIESLNTLTGLEAQVKRLGYHLRASVHSGDGGVMTGVAYLHRGET